MSVTLSKEAKFNALFQDRIKQEEELVKLQENFNFPAELAFHAKPIVDRIFENIGEVLVEMREQTKDCVTEEERDNVLTASAIESLHGEEQDKQTEWYNALFEEYGQAGALAKLQAFRKVLSATIHDVEMAFLRRIALEVEEQFNKEEGNV